MIAVYALLVEATFFAAVDFFLGDMHGPDTREAE